MELTRTEALKYISQDYDEQKPVLVHGTSVKSALELMNGRMISLTVRYPRTAHPINRGYLFFVPRKKAFAGHPLYDSITLDLEGGMLEDSVENYAAIAEQISFLNDILGFWPQDVDPIEFISGGVDLDELRQKRIAVSKMRAQGIKKLAYDTAQRKGVVLGINEQIFDKTIENGCDHPGEEVMIHLPGGLERRYLQYVYPFGELERRALEQFAATLR